MQHAVQLIYGPAARQLGQHHVQPSVQAVALAKAVVQCANVGHLHGPSAEIGVCDLAPFEQFEFEQHLGAISCVALGVLREAFEFAAGQGQCWAHFGEDRAMPRVWCAERTLLPMILMATHCLIKLSDPI